MHLESKNAKLSFSLVLTCLLASVWFNGKAGLTYPGTGAVVIQVYVFMATHIGVGLSKQWDVDGHITLAL